MKDMVDQKLLQFLHKLNTNKLPVPAVKHMYAESLLIYRLVKLKNNMPVKFHLAAKNLDERSHSLVGFSNYITITMIVIYEYLCANDPCLPCG